ncbi:hypothetical protein AAFF_G00309430 [Aldrovandia affinis]|uniref:Uncharacterized protein n=1 Tax=Aldrovandia affinis TaxID=143900 RepID=A0AAD7SNW3_9TELE|nr:hypothetical protein AAFF_G00309430 [Aldrovandia affinis]
MGSAVPEPPLPCPSESHASPGRFRDPLTGTASTRGSLPVTILTRVPASRGSQGLGLERQSCHRVATLSVGTLPAVAEHLVGGKPEDYLEKLPGKRRDRSRGADGVALAPCFSPGNKAAEGG